MVNLKAHHGLESRSSLAGRQESASSKGRGGSACSGCYSEQAKQTEETSQGGEGKIHENGAGMSSHISECLGPLPHSFFPHRFPKGRNREGVRGGMAF